MKKFDLSVSVEEYNSFDELPATDKILMEHAQQSNKSSYAPYSHFHVGAALRLEDGTVVCGNNQENVAYPSGLCAERVALFYAKSQYPGKKVVAVAIAARSSDFKIGEPVSPCGGCRQVIAEYEQLQHSKIRILMMGDSGKVLAVNSIEGLLPMMFKADELKK